MSEDIAVTRREKIESLLRASRYNLPLLGAVLLFNLIAATLEGFGLGFIVPIIELTRDPASSDISGVTGLFFDLFEVIGVPFTLEYIILGVSVVLFTRYAATFMATWLRERLRVHFMTDLKRRTFDKALAAPVEFYDRHGSDEVLNDIITHNRNAGSALQNTMSLIQIVTISLVYLGIALYLAPLLTVLAVVLLGVLTVVVRVGLESGYAIGGRLADANEDAHRYAQEGVQGIRAVKLYGVSDHFRSLFDDALSRFSENKIKKRRNVAAIQNVYQLSSAVTVFFLVYAGIRWTSLSFGELGMFLFAMFRLAPNASALNNKFYNLESDLPHLVRSYRFEETLSTVVLSSGNGKQVPERVQRIEYQDVSFAYEPNEPVLNGVSFAAERGEFVAFVGQSGAGKSTIASLLIRMYDPDSGQILADDTPITEFDIQSWREEIAFVRQDPYIFNGTLWFNLTIGADDPTEEEVNRVCEIARVSEFFDDLNDGYQTKLGEDGVQLSGGQRQRVALARALLKDASVLLLDEATSDLDTGIEQDVQRSIESMDQDYLVVAIAHRLSTVKNADRIYTIKQGEISEVGPHDDLIDNGGTYADLYQSQIASN
ncbi:multidrug ABC transporter permease [Haloarcula sp. CBA1115]|uniref:ABC transporter ATP-binding protein n=1 Tax=unclassified Haloarcula TaxID=2624677 RepID=UPI00059552FD|nr:MULTISPECIES: ABC transporter ATP-binding protein [unclassified Haloarcula]AJF24769.1 multidrug ABC transporter permease [Haloarcula sp. CBA1115]